MQHSTVSQSFKKTSARTGTKCARLGLSLCAVGLSLAAITAHARSESPSQSAGLVKVTPLGSHAGEFCRFDRAMIFEDPNGTRILYDAGRTVAGGKDPRLGKIDIVLVKSTEKPGGIGEPATAVVAPAIANAVASLTGKRVRRLPITAQAIKQA